jgi:hypothetical protein
MLSNEGRWVVVGIFALFLLLTTIWKAKRKGIIPLAITIAAILIGQSSANAQTFEELQTLSNQNSTVLKEIQPGESGQYGAITISQDEGSAGSWIEVFSPEYHFSGYKELITGIQGSKSASPTVSIGKINPNISVLLIQTYTNGYITGEKKLYLVDSVNNSSQELFIPGRIVKVFEKEGILFIDSHVGGYYIKSYTQIYTTLVLKGKTIISTSYQKVIVPDSK